MLWWVIANGIRYGSHTHLRHIRTDRSSRSELNLRKTDRREGKYRGGLQYVDRLKWDEIGDELGMSANAARQLGRRALNRIRRLIDE